eukprot:gene6848-4934_t
MVVTNSVFLIAACLLCVLSVGYGDPDYDLHPLRSLPGCAAYWQALTHSPQQSEEQLKAYNSRNHPPSPSPSPPLSNGSSSPTHPPDAARKRGNASVHRYLRTTVVASTADASHAAYTSTYRTAAAPRGIAPHRHSSSASAAGGMAPKASMDGGRGGAKAAPLLTPLEPARLSIIVLGTRDALHVGLGNLLMFLPAILHYAILTERLVVIDDRSLLAQLCRLVVCKVPLISQLRHWLFTDTTATTTATAADDETSADLAARFFHRQRYHDLLRRRHRWTATEFDVFFHPTHLDRFLWPLNGRDLKQLMHHLQSLHAERPLITLAGARQLAAQCVAAYTDCDVTRVTRGDIDCTDAAMYRFMFLLPPPPPPHGTAASQGQQLGPWLRVVSDTPPPPPPPRSETAAASSSWALSLWTLPPPPPLPTATAAAAAATGVSFDRLNAENRWIATMFQRLERLLQRHLWTFPQPLRTCLVRPLIAATATTTAATTAATCATASATTMAMGVHVRNQFDFFEGEVRESDPAAQAEIAAFYRRPERRVVFAALLTELHAQAQRWAQATQATQTQVAAQAAACFTVVLTADSVSRPLPTSSTAPPVDAAARRYRRERWMAVAIVDPAETAPSSAFHVKAADQVVGAGLWWPVLDWRLLSHVERLVVWRRQHSASVSTFALAAHRLGLALARANASTAAPTAAMLVQPRHGGGGGGALVAAPVVSITRDKFHLSP